MYLPNGNNESLLKYFLSRSILSRKKKYSHITYMSETLIHNFFVYIKLVLGNNNKYKNNNTIFKFKVLVSLQN